MLLTLVHGGSFLLNPPPTVLRSSFFSRLLLAEHQRRDLFLPLAVLLPMTKQTFAAFAARKGKGTIRSRSLYEASDESAAMLVKGMVTTALPYPEMTE